MSSKKCKESLDTDLPIGVKGHISVEKVTNTGHKTDCHINSKNHFIELEIKNHSPIECAVRLSIEIEDGKIEFKNLLVDTYEEVSLIDPITKYGRSYVVKKEVEQSAKKFQTDEISLEMKAESMDIPNPAPIDETLSIDVN